MLTDYLVWCLQTDRNLKRLFLSQGRCWNIVFVQIAHRFVSCVAALSQQLHYALLEEGLAIRKPVFHHICMYFGEMFYQETNIGSSLNCESQARNDSWMEKQDRSPQMWGHSSQRLALAGHQESRITDTARWMPGIYRLFEESIM